MSVEGIDTHQLEKFNEQIRVRAEKLRAWARGEGHLGSRRALGNLGKVGRWPLGGPGIEKPTRDFSVQMGSWKEVGDAIGVAGADDASSRSRPRCSGCPRASTEAIVLNCARLGVKLEGWSEGHADITRVPITGRRTPRTGTTP